MDIKEEQESQYIKLANDKMQTFDQSNSDAES